MSIENFEHIPEQNEDVAGRPIMLALIWTVVGIVGCTLIVWALMSGNATGGGRSSEVRPELVPPAYPFQAHTALERFRESQQAELDGWSWADREHHVVKVPASVAIDRYLDRNPAGGK